MVGNRQTKVGTRHRSPAHASKRVGTAFGTARLVGLALSTDDALLFRSVRPFHHRGDAEAMGSIFQRLEPGCERCGCRNAYIPAGPKLHTLLSAPSAAQRC